MSKLYINDIETFKNLTTLVFKEPGSKEYLEFVIHESRNDMEELLEFLRTKPYIVGFNCLGFDGQVIEHIYRGEVTTAEQIYDFAQKVITSDRFKVPYYATQLSHRYIDLYKVKHYDNMAKATSLKWIEFVLRWKKLADLPYDHTKKVTDRQITEVMRYNKNDVDITELFWDHCKDDIMTRKTLYQEYGDWKLMNMSDSSIGSYIFEKVYSEKTGKDVKDFKKGRTPRKQIVVGDLLFDYIEFDYESRFRKPYEFYKNLILTEDAKEKKMVFRKEVNYTVDFQGLDFEYGAGGLHACIEPGVYESDDEHEIIDVDFTSFYPFICIKGGIYPQHLSKEFCDVYEELYNRRKGFDKKTHFAQNYAYKIALNGSYGKFNSQYSFLYDPQATMATTVNGQLILSMLSENLAQYGQILQVNTDGLTVKVRKDQVEAFKKECKLFENMTEMELEFAYYKKMVIQDVNNYIAVKEDYTDKDGNLIQDETKRKGRFEVHGDIMNGFFHKNPSASVIPKAINAYFIDGIPVERTILEEENIHEFLIGIKKKRNFDYWLMKPTEEGDIDIDKKNDRVLRYYISKEGSSLYKHFNDGRKNCITGLNKGEKIKPAMLIRKPLVEKYEDLDKTYYISKAREIIKELEGND